jgi:hypothetical protein
MCNIPDTDPDKEWKSDDEWRQEVLQLIQDIFTAACSPMLAEQFASKVNCVVKAYLTDFIKRN